MPADELPRMRTSWRPPGRAAGRRSRGAPAVAKFVGPVPAFIPDWQSYPQTAALGQRNWPLLAQAIERGINSPRASSCGRLFDAVACALDCAPETLSYEGEAACRLEALAASCPGVSHPVTLPRGGELDLATFWQQWLRWQATPEQKAGLS